MQTLLITANPEYPGNYWFNVCHFPRLLRRTVWRLRFSQLVRGNLIANQLITLFPPARWVHVAAFPVKQLHMYWEKAAVRPTLRWVHLHHLCFSGLIVLFLVHFREQASHQLQGHRVTAGPWWLDGAQVTGWWPENKGEHWDASQGGPVRSWWIRFHQEPTSGWGLWLHQERDGLRQVPGYAHLSPFTLY